jgi:serine/threonine protein kinase
MTTPRPGFATGSLLAGKYQIQDEVGHGGMGIVYRTEDIKLKRPVIGTLLSRAENRCLQISI